MIPPYVADATLWLSLLPIPAFVIVTALIACGVLFATGQKAVAVNTLMPLSAFLLLGLVAGYLTGISRAPAVDAVLPAVLTLLGGAAAGFIGKSPGSALILRISGLILAFAIGLLVGTTWGSAMRQSIDDFDQSELELIRRSQVEASVREFRIARDLPPEMPGVGSGSKKDKEK